MLLTRPSYDTFSRRKVAKRFPPYSTFTWKAIFVLTARDLKFPKGVNGLFDISTLGNSYVLIGWLALKLAKSCQKDVKIQSKTFVSGNGKAHSTVMLLKFLNISRPVNEKTIKLLDHVCVVKTEKAYPRSVYTDRH